jgi:hypothetical protein
MYQYLSEISFEIQKFLILDTCHLDTVYLCEQGCEDLVIFLSQSHEQISLGATGLTRYTDETQEDSRYWEWLLFRKCSSINTNFISIGKNKSS